MIRLLSHSEIDFVKYDECIENSMQGKVYAMSWYLDAVFPNWSVYVVGDYDVVMPVPLKRKHQDMLKLVEFVERRLVLED